jgi:hypothetical protein
MIGITILTGILCFGFIYVAFRHVNIHEKRDLKTFKKLTKGKRK